MTPDRWERVSDVLDLVYDHPPEEWSAVLDDECTDEEVRAEVEAILESEDDASAFLEAGAWGRTASPRSSMRGA